MVTSRDVARVAGVSQATVSRVLNDSKTVSPEVRERVRRALDETGFVLNAQAKAMRTARSGAIGLVTSDIRNPYFPLLLDELTKAANSRGVKAVVWDDTTADGRYALDGFAAGSVDGLVLTSLHTQSTVVEALQRRNAPFVLCNRAPDLVTADVVMADHEGMTRSMAEYLISAGRRSFAAIFGSPTSVATSRRRAGFFEALQRSGIRVPKERVRSGGTDYESGVTAARELVASGERFDTLFCGSDIIAYGALDALRRLGVSVPGDVWVSGIDGLPMSAWGSFDLTTIQQDVPAIAGKTVETLLARIHGDVSPPVRHLVPTELIVRGSTAHFSSTLPSPA
ncbi:LacI family DNA-binding transcriptional regulator [Microbacterium sp. GXF0217]